MIYLASFIFSGFSFCVFSFPFHKYCFLTIRCGYPISSKIDFYMELKPLNIFILTLFTCIFYLNLTIL